MKINKKDIEHLKWIYDRLHFRYNENKNVDYMIRFKEIIGRLETIIK